MRVITMSLVLGAASLGPALHAPCAAQECEACPAPSCAPPWTACPPDQDLVPAHGPPPVTACYPPPRPSHTVELGAYDNYFGPDTVHVPAGTTVRWINYGRHRHTVTSYTGLFDSGEFGPGSAFSFTFTRPGTYSYYCRVHPREMRGTVVVR